MDDPINLYCQANDACTREFDDFTFTVAITIIIISTVTDLSPHHHVQGMFKTEVQEFGRLNQTILTRGASHTKLWFALSKYYNAHC